MAHRVSFLLVALFVHVANFMAVSYFGQIIMVWYMTLAVIASLDGLKYHAILKSAVAMKQFAGALPRQRAPQIA